MRTEEQEEDPIVPPEIDELLQRRDTFRGWLRKLNGMADEIRTDVHRRVLEDYRSRLDRVEEELSSHAAALEDSLEEKRASVAELEQEREQKAAALEEAEVRHAVGEFTGEEWENLRAESESDLSDLAERLDSERRALARLQEVRDELVTLDREEPEPSVEAGPGEGDATGVEGESRDATGMDAEPGAATMDPEAAEEAQEGGDYADELDFLESLSLEEPETLDSFAHLLDDEEDATGPQRDRPEGEGE